MLNEIDLSRPTSICSCCSRWCSRAPCRSRGRAAEPVRRRRSARARAAAALAQRSAVPAGRRRAWCRRRARRAGRADRRDAGAGPQRRRQRPSRSIPPNRTRRFIVAAPDGVSAVILPPLLADLRKHGARHRHRPAPASADPQAAYDGARLGAGAGRSRSARDRCCDRCRSTTCPRASSARTLYEEDFVVATRPRASVCAQAEPGALLPGPAPGGVADRRCARLRRQRAGERRASRAASR